MQARQITKIARELNKLVLKIIKDQNIGSSEIDMIHLIRHHPGISQKDIADNLNLDKAAITRSCNSLEKKGYITREKSKTDARAVCVYPTAKANSLKTNKENIENIYYEWLLSDIDSNSKAIFFEVLNEIYLKSKIESRNNFKNILEIMKEQDYEQTEA